MKAILMSIKPEWCDKIFSGEKTIEVRKVAPKLKPPFKVYVYQTKNRRGNKVVNEVLDAVYGGGKVIGEFVCDGVEHGWRSCVSNGIITSIKSKKILYIDDPKRYDTPKELWEFTPWCEKSRIAYDNLELCCDCPNAAFGDDGTWYGCRVTRPPRSWCYVEEIE